MDKLSLAIQIDGKEHQLKLNRTAGAWNCLLDGRETMVEAVLVRRDVLSLRIAGRVFEVRREATATETHVWVGRIPYLVEWHDPRSLSGRRRRGAADEGPAKLVAPMPGKVIRVLRKENDAVETGQGVLVMEAMKMQNEIKSPRRGTIRKIMAAEGSNVNAGEVLAIVE